MFGRLQCSIVIYTTGRPEKKYDEPTKNFCEGVHWMGNELLYGSFLLEFPIQKTHCSFLFLLLVLYRLLPLRWYSFLRVC